MKNLILVLLVILISCNTSESNSIKTNNDPINNKITLNYVRYLNQQYKIIKFADNTKFEFVEDTIPSNKNIIFCASAAFSKNMSYSIFSEKEIANDYIVAGKLKHGYDCPISKTGAFVSYNNKHKIVTNNFKVHKDSAIINKGYYFMQNLIINNGDINNKYAFNLMCSNVYRCLAITYNNETLFIQSPLCNYRDFIHFLQYNKEYKIKDAIYLDSGGWSYGFYRRDTIRSIDTDNKIDIIQNNYQTNYLIAY